MIGKIIETQTGNDFVSMTAKGFEEISTQRKYCGISTQIIGQMKNVRVHFNVDIGVGDVMQIFLEPVFGAIVDKEEWKKNWTFKQKWNG